MLASAIARVPAAGERSQVRGADDHAVGGERGRRRRGGKGSREPPLLQVLVALRRGVPDLDRAEMREVGRGIADALQHGKLAGLPQRKQRRERRMEPDPVRQLHDRLASDGKLRAQRVVRGIGVRHQRVEAVVAALQLDEDEQPPVVGARRRRRKTHADAAAAQRAERACGQRRMEESAAIHRLHFNSYAASCSRPRTSVSESAS